VGHGHGGFRRRGTQILRRDSNRYNTLTILRNQGTGAVPQFAPPTSGIGLVIPPLRRNQLDQFHTLGFGQGQPQRCVRVEEITTTLRMDLMVDRSGRNACHVFLATGPGWSFKHLPLPFSWH